MSHVEDVKVSITNLAALQVACTRLGVEFRQGQTAYSWFGTSVGDYKLPSGFKAEDLGKCAHAIHVPGVDYEIGVVPARNPDGTPAKGFTLLYDFFGSGGGSSRHDGEKLRKKFGTGLTKLVDMYSLEVLKAKARASGYVHREVARADGKLELRVSVP